MPKVFIPFLALSILIGSSLNLFSQNGSAASWGLDDELQVSGISTIDGFIRADAGHYHSIALHQDGSIKAWGSDYFGQVSSTPGGNDFIAIAAGRYH